MKLRKSDIRQLNEAIRCWIRLTEAKKSDYDKIPNAMPRLMEKLEQLQGGLDENSEALAEVKKLREDTAKLNPHAINRRKKAKRKEKEAKEEVKETEYLITLCKKFASLLSPEIDEDLYFAVEEKSKSASALSSS